jgi:hypothetical protein
VKGIQADRNGLSFSGVGQRPLAAWLRVVAVLRVGGDKCMGIEDRGVAYITIGDINLVF